MSVCRKLIFTKELIYIFVNIKLRSNATAKPYHCYYFSKSASSCRVGHRKTSSLVDYGTRVVERTPFDYLVSSFAESITSAQNDKLVAEYSVCSDIL